MAEEQSSYAVSESSSKGRQFAEKKHPYRTDFERDRDRIIHSEAFRRLEGKTQVFTPGINDNYRNRLTHSIEVAQIGRTIAKALRLNEAVTEAICLSHDLGHPPFGHMAERVLNYLMKDSGGFEHNRQTLRIVELLEHSYPDFCGLNLMYETRLALARHSSPYDKPESNDFPELNGPLEGQTADISDRIAYNCHDFEDGFRAGVITELQLKDIEIFEDAKQAIDARSIRDSSIVRTRTAKAIIEILVSDCIETSKALLSAAGINSIDAVYSSKTKLLGISDKNLSRLKRLERFLFENLYMHKSIRKAEGRIKNYIEKLFEKLCRKPELMPVYYQQLIEKQGLERTVCDYIAGMTDRFCKTTAEQIRRHKLNDD